MRMLFAALAVASLALPAFVSAQVAQPNQPTHFTQRQTVFWDQLVRCPGNSAVYYIGKDAARYGFPNEKTYATWRTNFNDVLTISCADLAKFPLRGGVTYQPGTRYVKLQTAPAVYAVEPGGVLRAIPDERWMEVFVGSDWAKHIDDLPDSFFPQYKVGTPLAPLEIPDGMTAQDPGTGTYFYFIDGQPKSLAGISFQFLGNDRFKAYTRTLGQAPLFYERVRPAFQAATRIESKDEVYLGSPSPVTDLSKWLQEDRFPRVEFIR